MCAGGNRGARWRALDARSLVTKHRFVAIKVASSSSGAGFIPERATEPPVTAQELLADDAQLIEPEVLPPLPRRESILDEAARLTSVDRQRHYGHPRHNFALIARLWSALLGVEVEPRMVGRMMIAMKIARDCNMPTRDNLTDSAGYARTMEMLDEAP